MKIMVMVFGLGALLASGCGGIAGTQTCHELTAASGSQPQTCAQTNDEPACTGGLSSGKCPSAGLVGCCKTSVSTVAAGVTTAACYYDATSASAAKTNCTGTDESWTTSAP